MIRSPRVVSAVVFLSLLAAAPAKLEPKLKPDAPEAVRAFWEKRGEYKAAHIVALTERLKELRKKMAKAGSGKNPRARTRDEADFGGYGFRETKAEVGAEIRQTTADIAAVKAARYVIPYLTATKSGMVGKVIKIEIDQIVDGQNALVTIQMPEKPDNARYLTLEKEDVWLSGINTEGLSDAKMIEGKGLTVYVAGSKQYPTALGSTRTVPHLVVFEMGDFLDAPPTTKAVAKAK